jgi:hypothetical protein
MQDQYTGQLYDYKFFCFDGEPKALFVATDRAKHETKFDFFDTCFNHLTVKQYYPNSNQEIRKPPTLNQMLELSEKLTQDMIHCRVDFYSVSSKLYFGELTFHHFCGMVHFEPQEWDLKFGDWSKLPTKEKK